MTSGHWTWKIMKVKWQPKRRIRGGGGGANYCNCERASFQEDKEFANKYFTPTLFTSFEKMLALTYPFFND
jgi:hypothetical protein